MQVTEDMLLNGQVLIRQPQEGYRVAIDPILLAASIEAMPGERVLDVGAGVGAASLCLAKRVQECKITGLETQWDYVRLAVDNINLNNLRTRVEMIAGDLMSPPPRLAAGTFNHVMANPPYHDASYRPSPNMGKALANQETEINLAHWVRFCLLMVKPQGTVTFIHRADRLSEILSLFHGKVGGMTVFPLWPSAEKPAKRVIIRGRKNSNAPLVISTGLILHQTDGQYTKEAEAILRAGAPLKLMVG